MPYNTSVTGTPERLVLEGVPKIGYGVHLCPLPGSIYSYMEYTRDPCDYDYLMGVTGAAFRRIWSRDDGGNVDLMYFAPEPCERAFRALGYDYRTVPNDDKATMIAALRECIAGGRPAIAFGIIGPPEAGIIAGYDKGGEVMIGYSYFQDADIEGYYETSDWFETMDKATGIGLILVGAKKPKPAEREVLISTLEWAIELERTAKRPGLPDHICGLAACDAWAAGMEVDADHPKDDMETLGTRVMVHCDQCVMLEERRSAAKYLRSMGKTAPEAAGDLEAAAGFYEQAAGLGASIYPWDCYDGDAVHNGLADPRTRRKIAKHIRAAGEKEARAVEYLERALAVLKGKPE